MIGPVQPAWHALAVRTAEALREANEKLDRPFPPNMSGACSVATMVLAEVLMTHGETPLLVCGWFERENHTWLVVRGWMIDLTASQFGDEGLLFRVMRARSTKPVLPKDDLMWDRWRNRRSRSYVVRGTLDLSMASEGYRKLRPYQCEHHSHPRRHHPLIMETFQRVLGWTKAKAKKRTVALVGSYVPDPLWWPKGPPSWAAPKPEKPLSLRSFLGGEEPAFLEELPPIERSL